MVCDLISHRFLALITVSDMDFSREADLKSIIRWLVAPITSIPLLDAQKSVALD